MWHKAQVPADGLARLQPQGSERPQGVVVLHAPGAVT